MPHNGGDSPGDLESRVAQLRQALHHWQTWELEYEALREGIARLSPATPDAIRDVGRQIEGQLVTANEVEELLGPTLKTKRSAVQVIDMLSKRVDYVRQNITTLENTLKKIQGDIDDAIGKVGADRDHGHGLPMADIIEELDDDGNVISSSVSHPGKDAANIMDTLQKAGVRIEDKDKQSTDGASASSSKPSQSARSGDSETTSKLPPKKSVTFADNTKPDPFEPRKTSTPQFNANSTSLVNPVSNPTLSSDMSNRGNRVVDVDENGNDNVPHPVDPEEIEEHAALRRDMYHHALSEVGPIVAEIDLDEGGYTDDDFEEYDSDDSSEPEDEHGRSLRSQITPEYRAEMEALKKKLENFDLQNLGPNIDPNDVKVLVVQEDKETPSSKADTRLEPKVVSDKKKAVRFATELDISSASTDTIPAKSSLNPSKASEPAAISDTTVERNGSSTSPSSRPRKAKAGTSRFKAERLGGMAGLTPAPRVALSPGFGNLQPRPINGTPAPPEGHTLAESIVERTPDPDAFSAPMENDGLDPGMLTREIEDAYHKARNQMIQKNGGFLRKDGDEETELIEELEDGRTRKVSRFRAARLKADSAI